MDETWVKFLQDLLKDGPQEKKKIIEKIINFDYDSDWAKRLIILNWFLLGSRANEISLMELRDLSCSHNENSIVSKFKLERWVLADIFDSDNIFIRGGKNARNIMNDLAKEGLLVQKSGKNYELTPIGKNIALFIYFEFLRNQKIYGKVLRQLEIRDLMNKEFFKLIDYEIEDLIRFELINFEGEGDNYVLTPSAIALFNFLRTFSYLDEEYKKVVRDNCLNTLEKNLISIITDKKMPKLFMGDIEFDKKGAIEINWLYRLSIKEADEKFRNFKLEKWLQTIPKQESKMDIQNQFLIIQSPAGRGKTIWMIQTIFDLLNLNKNQYDSNIQKEIKVLPLFMRLKDFYLTYNPEGEQIIIYNSKEMLKIPRDLKNESLFYKDFFYQLFRVLLFPEYSLNAIKTTVSQFADWQILLLLDGWDELDDTLKKIFNDFLKRFNDFTFLSRRIKTIITSRYLDRILSDLIEKKKEKDHLISIPYTMEFPTEEQILEYFNYLKIEFVDTEGLKEELKKRLGTKISPLDLWLITLFPNLRDLPKNRAELYQRWIKYEILIETQKEIQFNQVKIPNDIEILLTTSQPIIRPLDNKEFNLNMIIDGPIPSTTPATDQYDYSIIEFLPILVYELIQKGGTDFNYDKAISANPVLKRFIHPVIDKNLKKIPMLSDFHYLEFFIALHVFRQSKNKKYIHPTAFEGVGKFLEELFELSPEQPDIPLKSIITPQQFVTFLYLNSEIVLDPLNLIYPGLIPITFYHKAPDYYESLTKAFIQYWEIAIQDRNSNQCERILKNYSKFLKERPTITFGSALDEFTKEWDFEGEPDVNHSPSYYLPLIVELEKLSPFEIKSYDEFHLEQVEKGADSRDIYISSIIPSDYKSISLIDSSYYGSYVKLRDLTHTLLELLKTRNYLIYPWLFSTFDDLKMEIPENELGTLVKKYEDPMILKILLPRLFKINFSHVSPEFDRLYSKNDDYLFQIILEYIIDPREQIIPDNIFSKIMKIFLNSNASEKTKIMALVLISKHELTQNQLKILREISITEKIEEVNFYLNSILLLHRVKINAYHLKLSYALKFRHFWYFDLLFQQMFFNFEDINKEFLRLPIELVLGFSKKDINKSKYKKQILTLKSNWKANHKLKSFSEILEQFELFKQWIVASKSKGRRIYDKVGDFGYPSELLLHILENLKDKSIEKKVSFFNFFGEFYYKYTKSKTNKVEYYPFFDFDYLIKVLIRWIRKEDETLKHLLLKNLIASETYYEIYRKLFRYTNLNDEILNLIRNKVHESLDDFIIKPFIRKYQEKSKKTLLFHLPEREIIEILTKHFNLDKLNDLENYIFNITCIGTPKAYEIVANLWENNYFNPNIARYEDRSYHIWQGIPADLIKKIYKFLKTSSARIIFLLAMKVGTSILEKHEKFFKNNISKFPKHEITEVICKLLQTDWKSFNITPLFEYCEITAELEQDITSYIKNPVNKDQDLLHLMFQLPKNLWAQRFPELVPYILEYYQTQIFEHMIKLKDDDVDDLIVHLWEKYFFKTVRSIYPRYTDDSKTFNLERLLPKIRTKEGILSYIDLLIWVKGNIEPEKDLTQFNMWFDIILNYPNVKPYLNDSKFYNELIKLKNEYITHHSNLSREVLRISSSLTEDTECFKREEIKEKILKEIERGRLSGIEFIQLARKLGDSWEMEDLFNYFIPQTQENEIDENKFKYIPFLIAHLFQIEKDCRGQFREQEETYGDEVYNQGPWIKNAIKISLEYAIKSNLLDKILETSKLLKDRDIYSEIVFRFLNISENQKSLEVAPLELREWVYYWIWTQIIFKAKSDLLLKFFHHHGYHGDLEHIHFPF